MFERPIGEVGVQVQNEEIHFQDAHNMAEVKDRTKGGRQHEQPLVKVVFSACSLLSSLPQV